MRNTAVIHFHSSVRRMPSFSPFVSLGVGVVVVFGHAFENIILLFFLVTEKLKRKEWLGATRQQTTPFI